MERAIPILPAEDLSTAKAFYVNGLGFRVTFEASKDGRSGLLGIERGTIQLTLDSPMKGHGRNACVALQVDDADAYYREWSAYIRPPRPIRQHHLCHGAGQRRKPGQARLSFGDQSLTDAAG